MTPWRRSQTIQEMTRATGRRKMPSDAEARCRVSPGNTGAAAALHVDNPACGHPEISKKVQGSNPVFRKPNRYYYYLTAAAVRGIGKFLRLFHYEA